MCPSIDFCMHFFLLNVNGKEFIIMHGLSWYIWHFLIWSSFSFCRIFQQFSKKYNCGCSFSFFEGKTSEVSFMCWSKMCHLISLADWWSLNSDWDFSELIYVIFLTSKTSGLWLDSFLMAMVKSAILPILDLCYGLI